MPTLSFAWRFLTVSKEKRLGRGLEALLGKLDNAGHSPGGTMTSGPTGIDASQPGLGNPGTIGAFSEAISAADPAENSGVIEIPIDDIEPNPFQPRKEVDAAEIAQLADSLNNHGLLQPIVVRRHHGHYQLIAGERRFRAAKLAGWDKVPARVVEADDRQLAELAIVENLQRKDLNALEKAHCFRRYLEEYGVTQEELASRLSLDRSTISNFIRLLDLPEPVQQALREGRITQGHARALLSLDSDEEQIALCQQIEREGWSVRRVEAEVQAWQKGETGHLKVVHPNEPPSPRSGDEHLAQLEQEFRAALGLKVSLTHNGRGRGKLTIHFRNHEEFERLRERICEENYRRAAGM